MPDAKLQPAVLYLERNRAWYYTVAIPNILLLDFPQDIISDLEVLNKEKLQQLVKVFIEVNKIEPSLVSFILSPDITFEKELPEGLPVEIEGETKSFLNFVPFEDTYQRTIKLGKSVKVVAVNKELCNDIKVALQEQKFQVISIIPFSILQQTVPELSTSIDLPFILSRIDSIRQYNLLGGEVAPVGTTAPKNSEQKDNKRVYILLGVFSVLFLILGYVIYTTVIAPPTPTSQSATPTIIPPQETNNSNPQGLQSTTLPVASNSGEVNPVNTQ